MLPLVRFIPGTVTATFQHRETRRKVKIYLVAIHPLTFAAITVMTFLAGYWAQL